MNGNVLISKIDELEYFYFKYWTQISSWTLIRTSESTNSKVYSTPLKQLQNSDMYLTPILHSTQIQRQLQIPRYNKLKLNLTPIS